jgi:hypothetical protein
LYLAAENGHAKVVRCLLQAKADKDSDFNLGKSSPGNHGRLQPFDHLEENCW